MPPPARRCSSDCAFPATTSGEEAKVKLGPPLNGLDGRKAGTIDGLQLFPGQQELRHHLERRDVREIYPRPMQEMPGTRMAFVGIKNDKDIADLWAYLKQFGADGKKK